MEPTIELVTPALEISKYPHYIELAARECYQSQHKAKGDPGGFVKMLIRRGHTSALEHCKFIYRVICSRAASHQLVRHRHSSYSQQSQRYVVPKVAEVICPPGYTEAMEAAFKAKMADVYEFYGWLMEQGAKPEDARFVLPNACVTRVVTSSNMRQIRQVFALRLENHAQWEIRMAHQKLFDMIYEVAPCFVEDLYYLRHHGTWEDSRPPGL
jgi:thymidylate synthase (FAD)